LSRILTHIFVEFLFLGVNDAVELKAQEEEENSKSLKGE